MCPSCLVHWHLKDQPLYCSLGSSVQLLLTSKSAGGTQETLMHFTWPRSTVPLTNSTVNPFFCRSDRLSKLNSTFYKRHTMHLRYSQFNFFTRSLKVYIPQMLYMALVCQTTSAIWSCKHPSCLLSHVIIKYGIKNERIRTAIQFCTQISVFQYQGRKLVIEFCLLLIP